MAAWFPAALLCNVLRVLNMARGEDSGKKKEEQEKKSFYKYVHDMIQALVYLWLEKPNIAE